MGVSSKRTVLHHHRLLREILQHAVKWQVLARNPADAVEAPRPTRTEMYTLNRDQAARLLSAIEGCEYDMVIRIALQTGLRLGELLGLRWQDVDLVRGEIHIVQTLQRVRRGDAVFGQPKTHRSRRSVALSPDAVEVLRRHRTRQVEERLAAGSAYTNRDLVFADPNGEPINGDRLRRAFYRLLKDAGLPRLRLHDLRHTMATLMLSQHVHPKILSERLGHATVGITLDT